MSKEPISLEKFNSLLQSKYLFHIHTTHTDGHLSVADYFRFAQKYGFRTLVFTEHVRREMKYDFGLLLEEIHLSQHHFPDIIALTGAEAKILPGGHLDIPDPIARQIDVLCIACHGFPADKNLYYATMETVFRTCYPQKIRVWVHPALFFKNKFQLFDEKEDTKRLEQLVKIANRHHVYGEKNTRYGLPGQFIPFKSFHYPILGVDAHRERDLAAIIR